MRRKARVPESKSVVFPPRYLVTDCYILLDFVMNSNSNSTEKYIYDTRIEKYI
jgi:hypothetical protein